MIEHIKRYFFVFDGFRLTFGFDLMLKGPPTIDDDILHSINVGFINKIEEFGKTYVFITFK